MKIKEKWMTELMKTANTSMTLKEILKDVNKYLDYFFSQTIDGHIIHSLNGFVGVGILDEPRDHLTPKINTIWMFSIGFNHDASEIEEQINIELTVDEAEDIQRTLKICIDKFNVRMKK